jgi:hypothetical protein
MKHITKIAVVVAFVAAGVAFSAQVKDDAKKPAAKVVKKSECCANMKSKAGGKMSCCSSDSTAMKEGESGPGKH